MSLSRGNYLALQREPEMWFSCTQTVPEETFPVKWTVEAYILNKLEKIVVYSTSSIQSSFRHKNVLFFKKIPQMKWFSSVQSLSRVQLFATPWIAARQASLSITNSRSLPTYVHRVGDAIQPSHPLSSPSPPAPNPSQHQSLCQWVNSSHEVAKVLEFQLQHQSFQWLPHYNINYFLSELNI